jgi:hypothetical protein
MGSWGHGNFDNDAVLDWKAELSDWAAVRYALTRVARAEASSALGADACCVALGAAEVVAACTGHPYPGLPADVTEWVARHGKELDVSLVPLAAEVASRIEERSDLQELFDEGGRNQAWHEVVQGLIERLRG